jgi:hypothetical protein
MHVLGYALAGIAFVLLCRCYLRIQMRYWYGESRSRSKKSDERPYESPFVIEIGDRSHRGDDLKPSDRT